MPGSPSAYLLSSWGLLFPFSFLLFSTCYLPTCIGKVGMGSHACHAFLLYLPATIFQTHAFPFPAPVVRLVYHRLGGSGEWGMGHTWVFLSPCLPCHHLPPSSIFYLPPPYLPPKNRHSARPASPLPAAAAAATMPNLPYLPSLLGTLPVSTSPCPLGGGGVRLHTLPAVPTAAGWVLVAACTPNHFPLLLPLTLPTAFLFLPYACCLYFLISRQFLELGRTFLHTPFHSSLPAPFSLYISFSFLVWKGKVEWWWKDYLTIYSDFLPARLMVFSFYHSKIVTVSTSFLFRWDTLHPCHFPFCPNMWNTCLAQGTPAHPLEPALLPLEQTWAWRDCLPACRPLPCLPSPSPPCLAPDPYPQWRTDRAPPWVLQPCQTPACWEYASLHFLHFLSLSQFNIHSWNRHTTFPCPHPFYLPPYLPTIY